MDSLERQAVDGELNRWGRWIERHADYEGFPAVNSLVAALQGAGGGQPGHRILCLDMPDNIYATHGRILRLSEREREAVYLFYAVKLKPDGTLWTVTEKCRIYGIQEDSMRRRVSRARHRILGLPLPEFMHQQDAIAIAS